MTAPVTPTLSNSRPLVIAHRGASAIAPPNTLAAFAKALELGADGVELDVHLSADGVPIVIHDFTVDATTDGHGRVADLTLAQLKQLDVGSRFGAAFAGERIPTLEEALDILAGRLLVNIELKSISLRDNGLERAVVALIERLGASDAILLSSFNPFALRRVKKLAPHIPTGLLYTPSMPLRRGWPAWVAPLEALHPEHTIVNMRTIAWAHRRGYRVYTWTVDDRAEMQRLIALGVDGIITNVPDVLRQTLAGP